MLHFSLISREAPQGQKNTCEKQQLQITVTLYIETCIENKKVTWGVSDGADCSSPGVCMVPAMMVSRGILNASEISV